jgi:hypothetical protein
MNLIMNELCECAPLNTHTHMLHVPAGQQNMQNRKKSPYHAWKFSLNDY